MKEHNMLPEKTNRHAEWIWRTAVLMILGLLAFFFRDIYLEQRAFNNSVENRLVAIELKQAETAANRFTSGDWVQAKTQLDSSYNGLDKRVTRVEDAVSGIHSSLQKIDNKLDAALKKQ